MSLCTVDGCLNAEQKGGLCHGHIKRRQRGDALTPLKQRPATTWERITEAALAYANADSMDDREFRRASDNLRTAVDAARVTKTAELLHQAQLAARRRGVHIGRPAKYPAEEIARVLDEMGHIGKAAARLQVSHMTVRRALARLGRRNGR